jgi:uncharacterized protein YjiS (DUF1127 family)
MFLLNLLISARDAFAQWQKQRQAFSQLMALDDHSLADIGVRRSEIRALCEGGRGARAPAKAVEAELRKSFAQRVA